jgi:hypothetical protein
MARRWKGEWVFLVPTQNIQHRVIFHTRGPLLLGLYDRGNHMGVWLHLVKDSN